MAPNTGITYDACIPEAMVYFRGWVLHALKDRTWEF